MDKPSKKIAKLEQHDMLPLGDIVLNAANPREQEEADFYTTIQSLLVFPKMLFHRRITLDSRKTNIVLGGNMRTNALNWIAKASDVDIEQQLQKQSKYNNMTEVERENLRQWWREWQLEPLVPVDYCDEFTYNERKEFTIKDNLSYGKWNWDDIANNFDTVQLKDWGMDVWQNQDDVQNAAPVDEMPDAKDQKEQKDLSDQVTDVMQVVVDCSSEFEQEELFNELQERGYKCRVLTL